MAVMIAIAVLIVFCFVRFRAEVFNSGLSTGPVQIFAGKTRLLVFLEFDRLFVSGGQTFDAPNYHRIGHRQFVCSVNPEFDVERVEIGAMNGLCGITFNPNISTIHFAGDKLGLTTGGSRDFSATEFDWNGERFLKVGKTVTEPDYENLTLATGGSGWSNVLSGIDMWDDKFRWDGNELRLNVQRHDGQLIANLVRGEEQLELVRVDVEHQVIGHRGRDALPGEESGVPK